MSYSKPEYKIEQHQTIQKLTMARLKIPNENRRFEWTGDEWILPVLEDLRAQMRNMKCHNMGQFIILEQNGILIIYDAQHRVTVLFLSLLAIAEITDNIERKTEILNMISKNSSSLALADELTEEERAICIENNWNRFPKLASDNLSDFLEFGNLINSITLCNSTKYILQYSCSHCSFTGLTKKAMKTHKEHKEYTETYKCKGCEFNTTSKDVIEEHVAKKEVIESVIPQAYSIIKKFICEMSVESSALYQYIVRHVYFDIKLTTSEEDARRSYLLNNTIGKTVSSSDRMKPWLIGKLPGRKEEITNLFNRLLLLFNNDTKSPVDNQQILYICSNFLRKDWYTYENFNKGGYEKLFEKVPEEQYTIEFNRFIQLIEKCIDILEFVKTNRYGKILLGVAGGCEVTTLYILPIGLYFGKETLERYFNLLIASSIRSVNKFKSMKLTLNALEYQTPIINILKNLLKDSYTEEQCYSEFVNLLKPKSMNHDSFIAYFGPRSFKNKNPYIKTVLQFIVEQEDSHEARINIDTIDLEHIHAQNRVEELSNQEHLHTIGNLTLFSAPNSGEMRGNRSLKDLSFSEKLPHYSISNIRMTRELDRYKDTGFSDIQIEERSSRIIQQLYSVTERILSTPR